MQEILKQLETLGRIARSNAALSVTPDAWKEHAARITDLYEAVAAERKKLEALELARNRAYSERNRVACALAEIFPSGIRKTAIESWEPEWHNCVYIELPTGQISFHYHDDEAVLFEHLPPYTAEWDGHGKDEVYARLAAIAGRPLARYLVARHIARFLPDAVVPPTEKFNGNDARYQAGRHDGWQEGWNNCREELTKRLGHDS